MFDAERPDTTFADVAGYEGAKREVSEVVDFLKNPDRYRRAGACEKKLLTPRSRRLARFFAMGVTVRF